MKLIIITYLLVFFGAYQTFACSCNRVRIKSGHNTAKIVFTGKLVDRKVSITNDTVGIDRNGVFFIVKYQRVDFKFEVIEILKGTIETKNITVTTTAGGADCGNDFDLDKNYLVYTFESKNKLHYNLGHQVVDPFLTTSLCTRTRELRNRMNIEILRLRMLKNE